LKLKTIYNEKLVDSLFIGKSMSGKLENNEILKEQLNAVIVGIGNTKRASDWYRNLALFLQEVTDSIPSKLDDIGFLTFLWDESHVAATGMGSVKIAPALENTEFRQWFRSKVLIPLPDNSVSIEANLIEFYDELQSRLKQLCGRTPRLKLNRVLCALYPEHLTTIADVGALRVLFREIGGHGSNEHPITMHMKIRGRIDEVLGQVSDNDHDGKIRRTCLPWLLYERIAEEDSRSLDSTSVTPLSALIPLPATLRRKGLTAIKGSFPTLLGLLPELKDGVTREEFSALLAQISPNATPGSIGTTINVISREFDICKREGDTYQLSARGLNLLDTQDPDELADHLVTRILGVDNVLKKLEAEPQTKPQLFALLKGVHSGWKSDAVPHSVLIWLSSLGAISLNEIRKFELTERGLRWAEMITWIPQSLPNPDEAVDELKSAVIDKIELPRADILLERLQKITNGKLMLDNQLVSQLHGGLWFHPIRHFVVLTGISGSGKTQLALNYALALCDANDDMQEQVRVIPVQPGWYDPSPLLGYVNPIQDTSYRSAPFLELLQRAAGDPDRPYVAILDEMNLSHPEQYLAPILSAMETRGWIELHQLDEESSSIKQRIQYPANLAIIGTLNMDETTHGLSDKVLDRAYTLEFWNISVNDFPGWATVSLPNDVKETTRAVLDKLVKALDPVRLHFGWRTIDDVLSYLTFQLKHNPTANDSLDSVIYAKVLPKLRGEGIRFQSALQSVYEICLSNGLSRCARKIQGMQADLVETGSARYWR